MFESLTAWPLKNFCHFFLFNKSLSKNLKTKLGGSRCDTNFANPAQFAFACQCIENLIWPSLLYVVGHVVGHESWFSTKHVIQRCSDEGPNLPNESIVAQLINHTCTMDVSNPICDCYE